MAHKSDRRLYLDAEGKVVEADDPSRAQLLVSKGGEIPMEDARRYGLLDPPKPVAPEPTPPTAEDSDESAPDVATEPEGEETNQSAEASTEDAPEPPAGGRGRGRGRAATGQAGDAD